MSSIVVLAKAPVAGRSKTRLCPPLLPSGGAAVAEAAIRDTLAAVLEAGTCRRMLALDGEAGPWLPRGFDVVPQRGRGLAQRVAAAFEDAGGPAVLIGMDTPQVDPEILRRAARTVERPGAAVFGEAADGGWWIVGLHRPDARAFRGVPMSTSRTGALQRARLRTLGLPPVELPVLRDVDRIEDALEVAALLPGSRFARALLSALSDVGRDVSHPAGAWEAAHHSVSGEDRPGGVRLRAEDGSVGLCIPRGGSGCPARRRSASSEGPSPRCWTWGAGPGATSWRWPSGGS